MELEKKTREEKSKENLRRALGKRSHSKKLEFFWNYKVNVGIWFTNRDMNVMVEESLILFGLMTNVDIC